MEENCKSDKLHENMMKDKQATQDKLMRKLKNANREKKDYKDKLKKTENNLEMIQLEKEKLLDEIKKLKEVENNNKIEFIQEINRVKNEKDIYYLGKEKGLEEVNKNKETKYEELIKKKNEEILTLKSIIKEKDNEISNL